MTEIDSRLLTAGAVLTASGAAIACAGMGLAGFAILTASRRMLHRMEVSPTEQAAVKWKQAREASRAGKHAWQSAANGRSGQAPQV
jgi:hypothetical protein